MAVVSQWVTEIGNDKSGLQSRNGNTTWHSCSYAAALTSQNSCSREPIVVEGIWLVMGFSLGVNLGPFLWDV